MFEKKLLLWDIDGTIMCTGKAGEIALGQALEKRFGIKGSIDQVDYRGRTDRRIGEMLLEHYQIERSAEHLHEFMETYLGLLEEQLPKCSGKLHLGILDILEISRQREDYINALLTGNLERGARLKCTHYDVWHYFEFGAFADDSAHRNELGPVALKRATEKTGFIIPPERVFVIGDTPHDISCARVIGAKAIAVATGGYTLEELREHQPDALFADFSEPEAFFQAIDRL